MEAIPLVDWEQLDAIADGWDPDFVEIYREFEGELPADLDLLDEALAKGDSHEVARAAHRAKGCAANFGFERVRQAMLEIEMQAKAGILDGATGWLESARNGFREASEAVNSGRLSGS